MMIENEKAKQFISKLLINPSMRELTLLQKEEQIIQFLHINGAKLYPTLSSSSFFPGKNLTQVNNILLNGLFQIIDEQLIPELRTIIYEKLHFSFISFLGAGNPDEEAVRFQLFKFIEKMLKRPVLRRQLTGPHRAVTSGLPGKYLTAVYERRKYILFEMIKIQKLRMSKSDLEDFIAVSMFLKPAVHLMEPPGKVNGRKTNPAMIQSHYIHKLIEGVKGELSQFPESVICSGINSNLSFLDNKNIEATARFASVFSSMGMNYHPEMKIDRGALSADSSWFNVARKNFRFNGYDKDMLNELYNISVENRW